MDDEEVLLTTSDNPFNPFTQFDEWNAFDMEKGYNTCNYLARIVKSSSTLSESVEFSIIREAIDEILSFNLTGNYVKVTRESFEKMIEASKKKLK